ncbi:protein of unknown function [Asanoa hainanensis]|uniref:DUF4034 domain-containing protein n=1 Tax=Asanoa hainanensis TaxID=560556 RepID=A0A239G9K0_9ACTN|nr:DUF4034 domain-containing protein [Asanoa hainanensis]SNS65837.1 protein of unknown function [Asanoa hainanensis]
MWPFKKRQQAVGLVIDSAQGDPRARALIDALDGRDWQTTRDLFAAAEEPDARAYLMEIAAKVDGVQDWIGQWVDAEPESTLPLLVQGCHAVNWAWEARGAQRAKYTKDEQFREFFRRLVVAENLLDEVIDRDPDDVTARTWLVMASRGRQVPPDEAQARFDAVVKRHPGHVVAHEHRLQYLCAKWFGSDDEMFAFAREATAQAPDGSLLPELVAIAHIEKWMSLPGGEDDAYMAGPEVGKEIVAAADRSVLHPAFTPSFGWVPRANALAMGLRMSGELETAARVFDLIGDQVGGWTWTYFGDPVKAFIEARTAAYASRA